MMGNALSLFHVVKTSYFQKISKYGIRMTQAVLLCFKWLGNSELGTQYDITVPLCSQGDTFISLKTTNIVYLHKFHPTCKG